MKVAIFSISWVDRKCFCSSQSFFSMVLRPRVGKDFLIIDASRLHSDTSHSVGLLCTSEQPEVGTLSTNTQQWQETGMQALGGIRTRNPKKRETADHVLYRANTGVGHLVSYSSSYICHGVGPLVDPFRSHAPRSLFKVLPWFLLPAGA